MAKAKASKAKALKVGTRSRCCSRGEPRRRGASEEVSRHAPERTCTTCRAVAHTAGIRAWNGTPPPASGRPTRPPASQAANDRARVGGRIVVQSGRRVSRADSYTDPLAGTWTQVRHARQQSSLPVPPGTTSNRDSGAFAARTHARLRCVAREPVRALCLEQAALRGSYTRVFGQAGQRRARRIWYCDPDIGWESVMGRARVRITIPPMKPGEGPVHSRPECSDGHTLSPGAEWHVRNSLRTQCSRRAALRARSSLGTSLIGLPDCPRARRLQQLGRCEDGASARETEPRCCRIWGRRDFETRSGNFIVNCLR
ncbi:hypothetical protein C8Q80DRAFT_153656 [Daedaleopsis nitida]|nr:hypothetical protein C8Q80DRAFT_153656 [Daedaleopsis nitida]